MTTVEVAGPWRHRHVAAHGTRFHVAESVPDPGSADAPLVLLLHGFPEFWWCWRAQLPALAAAGYRAVALDLRGYGGSDKTPRGYDPFTLSADIAGVVKALGERQAVVVGHGWGGYLAWATAVLHPQQVSAVCAVAAPHPREMLAALRRGRSRLVLRHLLAAQLPMLPERRLSRASGAALEAHLRAWAAPGADFPDAEALERYRSALRLWPAPHCALEYHRWLVRSRLRADGRRFNRAMRTPVTQPAYSIFGGLDPALPRPEADRTGRRVRGRYDVSVVEDAGHFVPEERPEQVSRLLTAWLATL